MKKSFILLFFLLSTKMVLGQQSLVIVQQSEAWFTQNQNALKKITPKNCDSIQISWDKAEHVYTDGKEYVKVPVNMVYKAGQPVEGKKKSKDKAAPLQPTDNSLCFMKVEGAFDCLLVQLKRNPSKHLNTVTLFDGKSGEFLVKQFDDILPVPKVNWYFDQPR